MVIEFGIVIFVNERHKKKARAPMEVTEFVMETVVNKLHPRKASSRISVTQYETTSDLMLGLIVSGMCA